MPEPWSNLLAQLECLVRFSAPGEGEKEEVPNKPNGRGAGGGSRRRRNPPSGGVLAPRDAKASWAVNIRPKNWGDKDKIWWGKIKSMREAQRISDIVHFYLGCDSVHLLFPSRSEHPPPPFRNSNLHHLASLELRMKYVKLIAKGDEHQARRKELMESVKDMIKLLTVEETTQEEEDEVVSWTLTGEVPALGGVADDDECRLSPQIPDLHQGWKFGDIGDVYLVLHPKVLRVHNNPRGVAIWSSSTMPDEAPKVGITP